MIQFEIGKTYAYHSPLNYDCVWTFKVISRTKTTAILENEYQDRIKYRIKIDNGVETIRPLGTYYHSPILNASKSF